MWWCSSLICVSNPVYIMGVRMAEWSKAPDSSFASKPMYINFGIIQCYQIRDSKLLNNSVNSMIYFIAMSTYTLLFFINLLTKFIAWLTTYFSRQDKELVFTDAIGMKLNHGQANQPPTVSLSTINRWNPFSVKASVRAAITV